MYRRQCIAQLCLDDIPFRIEEALQLSGDGTAAPRYLQHKLMVELVKQPSKEAVLEDSKWHVAIYYKANAQLLYRSDLRLRDDALFEPTPFWRHGWMEIDAAVMARARFVRLARWRDPMGSAQVSKASLAIGGSEKRPTFEDDPPPRMWPALRRTQLRPSGHTDGSTRHGLLADPGGSIRRGMSHGT